MGVSSLQLRAVRGRKKRKKKPKGKAGKTGGSSLFLLVLMKRDTKCSPAEAEEEMNGGRGTTTLAAHKTQICLNMFSHNGFRLFSPLPSAGWGSPRPQGSAVEGAARKNPRWGAGDEDPQGKGEGRNPSERGKRRGKEDPRGGRKTPTAGTRRAQPGAGGARGGDGRCPALPRELRGECERPLPPRW